MDGYTEVVSDSDDEGHESIASGYSEVDDVDDGDLSDSRPLAPSTPVSPGAVHSLPNVSWNERFQRIVESPAHSPEELEEQWNELKELTQEFINAAKPVVRTIVREESVPNHLRTIPTTNVGGVAGGSKYVYQGMFFKYATDTYGIYGCDANAHKVASHELLSMKLLIEARVPNLHFPLVVLMDFLGRRLIVSSLVPVSSSTLVYGSDDGGMHIMNNNEQMHGMMQAVAEHLNLKGHVASTKRSSAFLYGPVDLEGHLGLDVRYYVLDLARLMPPQKPQKDVRAGHLFRLLRPEFVRTNPCPLSSDGYTRWGAVDKRVHNAELDRAAARLLQETIPAAALSLETRYGHDVTPLERDLEQLTRELHDAGVNMRHAGRVRRWVSGAAGTLRQMILAECIARSLKFIINESLRENADTKNEKKNINIILTPVNLFFSSDPALHRAYWKQVVRPRLLEMFPGILSRSLATAVRGSSGQLLRRHVVEGSAASTDAASSASEEEVLEEVLPLPQHDVPVQWLFHRVMSFLGVSVRPSATDGLCLLPSPIEDGDFEAGANGIVLDVRCKVSMSSRYLQQQSAVGVNEKYREIMCGRQKVLGPQHPSIAVLCESWGKAITLVDPFGAIKLFARAIRIRRKTCDCNVNEEVLHVSNLRSSSHGLQSSGGSVGSIDDLVEEQPEEEDEDDEEETEFDMLRVSEDRRGGGGSSKSRLAISSLLLSMGKCYRHAHAFESALKAVDEAIRIKTLEIGADDVLLAEDFFMQGWILKDLARYDDAQDAFVRCITLLNGTSLLHTLEVGDVYAQLKTILAYCLQKQRTQHPLLLSAAFVELGRVLLHRGNVNRAFALQRCALRVAQGRLGSGHSRIGTIYNNLGVSYLALNQLALAKKAILKAFGIRRKALGDKHVFVVHSMFLLAQYFIRKGEADRGVHLLHQCVRSYQVSSVQRDSNPNAIAAESTLNRVRCMSDKVDQGRKALRSSSQCVANARILQFPLLLAMVLSDHASIAAVNGNWSLSADSMTEAVEVMKKHHDHGHPGIDRLQAALAAAREQQDAAQVMRLSQRVCVSMLVLFVGDDSVDEGYIQRSLIEERLAEAMLREHELHSALQAVQTEVASLRDALAPMKLESSHGHECTTGQGGYE